MGETKTTSASALVRKVFNVALQSQQPLAVANIERLRRLHPEKTPKQIQSILKRNYLAIVGVTGAGAGASAIVPNFAVQIPAALADLGAFLELSVLYTLSVAELHQLDMEDIERRRFLVLSVLVGNSAADKIVTPILERSVPHWGRIVVNRIPRDAIKAANKVLGPRFVTLYGARTGVLVLGKQIPLLIGAAVGGGGNILFASMIAKSVSKILGETPESWNKISYDDVIDEA